MNRTDAKLLALYALLAVLLTWPLAPRLGSVLPGGHADSYFHIWNYWWFHQALLVEHVDPLFCPYVLYPTGCELGLHSYTLTNSLLSLLLSPTLGLVRTFNLIIILGFLLAAGAMYALARELTGSRAGAFVAGLVYAFAPVHYQHLSRPDNAGIGWLPLAVLFLLRVWRRPRLLDGLGFGLFAAIAAYSSWYFLVALAALGCVVGLALLAGDRRRVLNGPALRALAAGIALLLVLIAPALLAMRALTSRAAFGGTSLATHADVSADLLAFVTPSWLHPAFRSLQHTAYARFTGTEPIAYLGGAALLLALLGLRRAPRRTALLWGVVVLVFLVLALGPWLHVDGRTTWTTAGGTRWAVPLPYAALYHLVPPLRGARAPIRFVIVAQLALAVLAAFAVRQFAGRRLLVVAVAAAVLFDFLAVPYPVVEVRVPAIYYRLAERTDRFAILEVPVTDFPSVIQLYQTVHRKPIPSGAVTHIPPWRFGFLGGQPVVRELADPSLITPARTAELRGRGRQLLLDANLRYVILHPGLIQPPAAAARIRAFLDAVLGIPPCWSDGEVVVWQLEETGMRFGCF